MIISQSSLLEERGQLACCRGGIARRRRFREKEGLLLREGAIEQPYDWRTCISMGTSAESQLNSILGSFTDR